MSTDALSLETALGHHQAGRLTQAADIYRDVLRHNPGHVRALHLLGLVEHQSGRHDAAIELIKRSIQLEPDQASFHNNLGEVYRVRGMHDEAQASYRSAIGLDPSSPGPYYNLALVAQARGDARSATENCRKAIAIKPDYVEAHYLLATALWALGDSGGTLAAYERVLAIDPRHADSLAALGTLLLAQREFERAGGYLEQALALGPDSPDLHVRLGDARSNQQDWPGAIACYQAAVRLDPQSAAAHTRLASALRAGGRLDEAIEQYRHAIDLAPRDAEASYRLASTLEAVGQADAAADRYRRTLELDANFANAHLQLGAYYQQTGQFQQALGHYDRALALEPNAPKAHFNRGFILLAQGRLAEGWEEFEWRMQVPDFPVRRFPSPRWDGAPLDEQVLLVHSEQGLGDTLQFARYLPWVRSRARRVVMLVHPQMARLLRQSGFHEVIDDEHAVPEVDVQVPLMSLPRLAGTRLANIPVSIPYVSADPALVASWRERLSGVKGFRVGICWQGSPGFSHDRMRSVPLQALAPLAQVRGVRLVSLQKGAGVEQLEAIAGHFDVVDPRPEYDVEDGAFMNAAAVMRNLDLVVTVDTAIAHLAGALGVRVWAALPELCDWRWMQNREDSPWYPSMRLFRQRRAGDWTELFDRVARALPAQFA
jgi:tetratricopeptide (TPR) repeat protein